MDFAVPADHRVKLKESEKRDKYLDLARELKKKRTQWNMKVTVILCVIGLLGTVIKGLVQELENLEIKGRVETIQTTAWFKSAKILKRFRETGVDLLSHRLQWETISQRWCEKLKRSKVISKCRLCGHRDETINHIISECSKLAQKEYKPRHNWVGKVIHSEMCKKFKFDHTNKWYMHNLAPV